MKFKQFSLPEQKETKKNNLFNIGRWLLTADSTTKVFLKKGIDSSAFLMTRRSPQTARDAKDLRTPPKPPDFNLPWLVSVKMREVFTSLLASSYTLKLHSTPITIFYIVTNRKTSFSLMITQDFIAFLHKWHIIVLITRYEN